jgi:hypothetical protein
LQPSCQLHHPSNEAPNVRMRFMAHIYNMIPQN